MSATVAYAAPSAVESDSAPVATRTWFIGAILASAAGIAIGLLWDISWHMTVGRDTFWTAPHLVEYVSGLVAGISCGYVVLRTTFAGSAADRPVTVRYWGFRGPLGAWITIWGTFAMLVSAPFDNWWHNAYGLDVKIVSPPHMLLFVGMLGILLGALALTASAQNRSAGQRDALRDAWLYAVAGGVVCLIFAAGTIEYSWPNEQHTALYYQIWGGVFPLMLVGYSRAGRLRYGATAAALVYMLVWFAMGQILRLVPAVPMLAPIWNPRTYLWPPYFPVLLIVPALGVDVVRQKLASRPPWLVCLALGATFVLLLLAVQWPIASYMVTGASHNWLFNGQEWPYSTRPGPWQHLFWATERAGAERNPTLSSVLPGTALAVAIATVSSRLGLAWGGWMARVRR
ncbi:MAG TPA: hypothetical protein VHE78_16520 [Gemmatimonadaceae bacterium]|nr:hypothetical protein [Gemmatimonadaceae bacterium]